MFSDFAKANVITKSESSFQNYALLILIVRFLVESYKYTIRNKKMLIISIDSLMHSSTTIAIIKAFWQVEWRFTAIENVKHPRCVVGKCSEKPMSYPNQARLDKHRTCHENASCTTCGKMFGAKRNLRRHEKNKHENKQINMSTNSNTSDGDTNGNAPIEQLA